MKTKIYLLIVFLFVCLVAVIAIFWNRISLPWLTNSSLESSHTSDIREVVTDVEQYEKIKASLGDHISIRHFPDSIPYDATDVFFYYQPGFLQGGTSLQLRLKLPTNRIDELFSEFDSQAIRRYLGGDWSSHADIPDSVPTTFFYTSGSDDKSFPSTFEIIVLGAEPYGDPDFKWNHGTTYGVAIDISTSEIVYWLEDW